MMFAVVLIAATPIIIYLYFSDVVVTPTNLSDQQVNLVQKSLRKANFDPTVHKAQQNCWISLLDFQPDDAVTPLGCHEKHIFHHHCIETWVKAAHNSCPVCRTQIKNLDRTISNV